MMPFDPGAFDIFSAGISGGKDSTALLLWLVYESGLPAEKIHATFCDTGNEDPLTYGYIDILRKYVFPILTLNPERDFWQLAEHKKRFPSRKARFCTEHLKVIPSREHVLGLLRENKRVMLINGVRKAEAHNSNDRGSIEAYGYDDGYACPIYRPLLDWSMDDIWAIHKRYMKLEWVTDMVAADPELSEEHKVDLLGKLENHRIPRNPLYDMGARRVGCFPCINSAKAEVRAIAKYRPGKIDFIEVQEQTLGGERGFASMFTPKTVPPRFQSKPWVRKSDGKEFTIATIRDVVRWSRTGKGAKGPAEDEPDIPSCDSALGACE